MKRPIDTASVFNFDSRRLFIQWSDGQEQMFDAAWLRVNNPSYRDQGTGQCLVDFADLPADPQIADVHEDAAERLRIEWDDQPHVSLFDIRWLREQRSNSPLVRPMPHLWRGSRDMRDAPKANYAILMEDLAVAARWLDETLTFGLGFVVQVPRRDLEVGRFAVRFGIIAETNYGKVFDVRAVSQPNHLAYTDRGLGLHTDNPYRDPVPGFQVLHCLSDTASGGDSLFVDGFAAAKHLAERDPAAFATLSRTPVKFQFASDEVDLISTRPILELDHDGELVSVHSNSRSMDLSTMKQQVIRDFYRSYRAFTRVLQDEDFTAQIHLCPGELVLFDNHRILHGRTAFLAETGRHLQGCYLSRDSILSTWRIFSRHCEGLKR